MNRDGNGGGYGQGGAPRGDRPGKPTGNLPPWKLRPRGNAKVAKGSEGAVWLDEELKAVADLKSDKAREKTGQYLVEGVRAVETLIDRAKENLVAIYESEGLVWNKALLTRSPGKVPVRTIPEREMELLSSTKTQQGLVAVAISRSLRINWETARRVTLVDAIQDPGNLGALFRSCAAFGFDAVVLGKGSVDPWNPRAVRGSSGLVATVPFEAGARLEQTLDFLRNKGFTIVGTSPHGKDTITNVDLKKKVALLVGNEGKGASTNLLDQCDAKVRIPMIAGVESLNVSVAHGILAAGLFGRE
jgi:RNA methyltransferase, TrmH family